DQSHHLRNRGGGHRRVCGQRSATSRIRLAGDRRDHSQGQQTHHEVGMQPVGSQHLQRGVHVRAVGGQVTLNVPFLHPNSRFEQSYRRTHRGGVFCVGFQHRGGQRGQCRRVRCSQERGQHGKARR